jgi:hypothetical protein
MAGYIKISNELVFSDNITMALGNGEPRKLWLTNDRRCQPNAARLVPSD